MILTVILLTIFFIVIYYNFVNIELTELKKHKAFVHEEYGAFFIYFRPIRFIPIARIWYIKNKEGEYVIFSTNSLDTANKLIEGTFLKDNKDN